MEVAQLVKEKFSCFNFNIFTFGLLPAPSQDPVYKLIAQGCLTTTHKPEVIILLLLLLLLSFEPV